MKITNCVKPPPRYSSIDLDVSENSGKTPKMDGEKNGKPY